MDGHLPECPGCRGRVGAESTSRLVLRARASQTGGARASRSEDEVYGARARAAAPRPMGAAPLGRDSRDGRAGDRAWRGGFRAVASHSATVLASELTLDHLKCFGLLVGVSGPPDARQLESKLENRYGWKMTIPDGEKAGGLTVVGARRCLYHDGGIAHVMYRYQGEPVSLFMLPETAEAPHDLAVMGHQTRIWSVGNTTYAVVMRGDRARSTRWSLRRSCRAGRRFDCGELSAVGARS